MDANGLCLPVDDIPQVNAITAADSAQHPDCFIPPAEILQNLRLTCRLLTLHPWFRRGLSLASAISCQPVDFEDFERLVEELSYLTRSVCLDRAHAECHREAFQFVLSQIAATLVSPAVESKLVELVGKSDSIALDNRLAELRRLVIDSARNDSSRDHLLTLR